jgi:hypothetical protein
MAATNHQISNPINTHANETAGKYCQAIGAPVILVGIGQVLMERDPAKVQRRPVQGGPGAAYHVSTKTGPIAFAVGASLPLIGAN